jgi:hypothetical protein
VRALTHTQTQTKTHYSTLHTPCEAGGSVASGGIGGGHCATVMGEALKAPAVLPPIIIGDEWNAIATCTGAWFCGLPMLHGSTAPTAHTVNSGRLCSA